jgi:hypothetical protein
MKNGSILLNGTLSAIYVGLLLVIYQVEILQFWFYMGFQGDVTLLSFVSAIVISTIMGALLPTGRSTRTLLLTTLHYVSFLPSVVILTTHEVSTLYPLAAGSCYVLLMIVSGIKTRPLVAVEVRGRQILTAIVTLIALAILLQIAFGGLSNFNLNILAVYEFRRMAAAELPGFFGYIYSNVSKVLIPLGLVLAVLYRKPTLITFILFGAIILFGMTHHKSVLFTPIFVLILYHGFGRIRVPAKLGFFFVAIPATCLVEILVINTLFQPNLPGQLTSLFVRRLLLVPPLLDSFYIDHFSENAKYYWSTTRFGLGLVEVPYDVSAPFMIGERFFGNVAMSANAGLLGSGYANAGFWGVILYAGIIGYIISALNAFGRRFGPDFVAAVSVFMIITIVTSTDITTAVLTHGLLALIIAMTLLPKGVARSSDGQQAE